jgi:Flp pilus assembly protein TadD
MGGLKRKVPAGILIGLLAIIFMAPVFGAEKTVAEYIAEGKEQLQAGNYNESIASLTAALKLDSKSIQALLLRGNAFVRKGYYDNALADYTEIIRLDPKNGKAYNNRAVAHWYNDEPIQSQSDLDKAEELGVTVNKEVWRQLRNSLTKVPVTPEEVQPTNVRGMLPALTPGKPAPLPSKPQSKQP